MPKSVSPRLDHLSTPALIRLALDEAKLLVRTEVLHARLELGNELGRAKRSGALLGAALALAVSAFSVFFVLLASLLPFSEPVRLLLVGGGLVLLAGLCAFFGVRQLSRKPMAQTQEQLKADFAMAKETLQ